jgi:hypothetical protein
MDSRQQFEEKILLPLGLRSGIFENGMCKGQYEDLECAQLWHAWKISRSSILVELPYPDQDGNGDSWDACWKSAVSECREAIHKQGIKTK